MGVLTKWEGSVRMNMNVYQIIMMRTLNILQFYLWHTPE